MVVKPKPCSEYLAIFLVGLKFNTKMDKPKLLKILHKDRHGKKIGLFECECGKEFPAPVSNVFYGRTISCGCYRKKNKRTWHMSHDMSSTRIYNIWALMISRCTKKYSCAFKSYGGRGITVCESWMKFENFYNDMSDGYSDELTIDRINNDGNYEPGNCRWVTPRQQAWNKRTSLWITYNNETKCLSEWADIYKVDMHMLYQRIVKLNWPIEKALTQPKRQQNEK